MSTVPVSTGDLRNHAETLSAMASAMLIGLASGEYDKEIATIEDLLKKMAVVFPPAGQVERALEIFLLLNKLTVPRAPVVPDGRGGFVPSSNSRYDQKTGEFL